MGSIIVNADDYGMSPEINAPILQAAKDSVIHSASVDVCNRITRRDVEKLLAAEIGIGLHLNLTEGRPIGNGEGIADLLTSEGCFKPASIGLSTVLELNPLVSELQHQLRRFRFLFERNPTHLDSHQHFTYLHPSASWAMLKIAKMEDIPIRSPKPFIQAESLSNFCERVRSRYGIHLPFAPEERAAVLNRLFERHVPTLRSQDLYLDFDASIFKKLQQEAACAEMIIHPQLDLRERNGF
jgi:predicted glycoside hydrolase/deacetylase ChbG (UPF0249 family)